MITRKDFVEHIGKSDVEVAESVIIQVSESLEIGPGARIRDYCIIKGRNVKIGKNFVMNHHAEIGGGSCFEKDSSLIIGDNCHLGSYAIINTSRAVKIGNEVGMGRFSNLYTHGAWLNPLEDFPYSFGEITIGNKVWIPSATILPNTEIGNNVVISEGAKIQGVIESGSHVTRSGKVIKKYPVELSNELKTEILKDILKNYKGIYNLNYPILSVTNCEFNLEELTINGTRNEDSLLLQNHLRRYGIRCEWVVLA